MICPQVYFSYFTAALKNPIAYAREVDGGQFINGVITMVLYSMTIPLIFYFGFHRLVGFMDHPFLDMVVRPTLAFVIFIFLTATYCFLAIKYGKGKGSYQDIIARFGVYLVPFTGLLLLALLMAVLEMNTLQSLLLMVGFFGSIFTVPGFVITSFIPESGAVLDPLQSTILVYIAAFLTVGLLGNVLFGPMGRLLGQGMSFFY